MWAKSLLCNEWRSVLTQLLSPVGVPFSQWVFRMQTWCRLNNTMQDCTSPGSVEYSPNEPGRVPSSGAAGFSHCLSFYIQKGKRRLIGWWGRESLNKEQISREMMDKRWFCQNFEIKILVVCVQIKDQKWCGVIWLCSIFAHWLLRTLWTKGLVC